MVFRLVPVDCARGYSLKLGDTDLKCEQDEFEGVDSDEWDDDEDDD